MKNKMVLLLFVVVLAMIGMTLMSTGAMTGFFVKEVTLEQQRENVLADLTSGIEKMQEAGKYGCCIEPACTMCYLGNWLWDDGSCLCDEMIANGEFDKVCPQCKKGIELGQCKSSDSAECEIDI